MAEHWQNTENGNGLCGEGEWGMRMGFVGRENGNDRTRNDSQYLHYE
jgi:hypothetical protein